MTQISDLIKQALKALALPEVNFSLEHPQNEAHGDYSTNVALVLYPQVKAKYQNPLALAQAIVTHLQSSISHQSSVIENVIVAPPGFINFTLKTDYLLQQLIEISQSSDFGKSNQNRDKLAIVEYSSPNIAKPFTVGHLRSTIIGDAIANLLEATGWKVLRDNHLGDWGTQFGKLIYAIKNWADINQIQQSTNPVKVLVDLYVKFHQEADAHPNLNDQARAWFKKLEAGDEEARKIWQICVDLSWKEFSRIYKYLNIQHSFEFNQGRGLGESFFETKMPAVIQELSDKNILSEGNEDAKLVFFENDKYPPAMILKKDGASLYHTRDLATDKYRLVTYHPDLILNEVGAEQTLYFQQLFEIERRLGWYQPKQRVHIGHGFYRFKDKKMSTRKGDVIWLEAVINEAVDRAKKLQKSINQSDTLAEAVGIGALKWNDLKGEASGDIIFDWDEILNMKGNSGPYLQYTHARCRSVLSKVNFTINQLSSYPINQLTPNPEELSLLRFLPRYLEVIHQAAQSYAPHLVCTYLYELAQRFNTFYHHHTILGSAEHPVNELSSQLRLLLTAATAQVLKNGLSLLGIAAPIQM